jgi:hypothetical protein
MVVEPRKDTIYMSQDINNTHEKEKQAHYGARSFHPATMAIKSSVTLKKRKSSSSV